jgi:hypothetical protein
MIGATLVHDRVGEATTDSRDDDFEALYRRERPGLVRLAFLLTGSLETAEDVVQEAASRVAPRLAAGDIGSLLPLTVDVAAVEGRGAARVGRTIGIATAIGAAALVDVPPPDGNIEVVAFLAESDGAYQLLLEGLFLGCADGRAIAAGVAPTWPVSTLDELLAPDDYAGDWVLAELVVDGVSYDFETGMAATETTLSTSPGCNWFIFQLESGLPVGQPASTLAGCDTPAEGVVYVDALAAVTAWSLSPDGQVLEFTGPDLLIRYQRGPDSQPLPPSTTPTATPPAQTQLAAWPTEPMLDCPGEAETATFDYFGDLVAGPPPSPDDLGGLLLYSSTDRSAVAALPYSLAEPFRVSRVVTLDNTADGWTVATTVGCVPGVVMERPALNATPQGS